MRYVVFCGSTSFNAQSSVKIIPERSTGQPVTRTDVIAIGSSSKLYNHEANGDPSVLNCSQTHTKDDHPSSFAKKWRLQYNV